MHTAVKTAGVGLASLALIGATAASASAESTIVKIKKNGYLSTSHNIAWVGIKVTCSPDTTDAVLKADLSAVTHGNAQTATGVVAAFGAFECSGNEEVVWMPIRRPTGGFAWKHGPARVSHVKFATQDPTGWHADYSSGRSIKLH